MDQLKRVGIPVSGIAVSALIHLPERVPAAVVVCCHGLLSHKDSAKFAAIGQRFSSRGLAVVRFDFSGCGESAARSGPLLESRLTDLRGVLDHVLRQPWTDGRIGLLGSSLGGYLTLLLASSKSHPIEAFACWATPFSLSGVAAAFERSPELRAQLASMEGFGSPMDLRDLAGVGNALVVQGQQDETVPWRDATEIYRRVNEPRRLLLVANGDHRLTDPEDRRLALEASLDWFRERGLCA